MKEGGIEKQTKRLPCNSGEKKRENPFVVCTERMHDAKVNLISLTPLCHTLFFSPFFTGKKLRRPNFSSLFTLLLPPPFL